MGEQNFNKRLLKASSDVAAILRTILEMSDEVKRGRSPLDMQGKLLRLHNSIQKNSPNLKILNNKLCDLIEESGGKLQPLTQEEVRQ